MIPFWRSCWRITLATLVIYWVALFVSTHVPSEVLDIRESNDKLLHTTAYAGLALLLAVVVVRRSVKPWFVYVALFCIVAGYGAFDEVTQQLSPGRHSDHLDWYCDVVGAALGIGCYRIAQQAFPRPACPA